MARIFSGRFTAIAADSFAVFLIGMRINRLFNPRWLPVASAMPPMIAELKRQPELGMLHVEFFLYWRGIATVQYWRSFDHLHAYAHARDAKHLPAWAVFNRRIGANGSVGIWHETYVVNKGQYECIYANMPRFGLAQTGEHVPVAGRLEGARDRIGQTTQ